jgi:hypothetical protein
MEISVYPIGSEVLIDGTITARVTAIMIRAEVSYEVVWWNDRERRVEWVEHWEIASNNDKTGINSIL